MKKNMILVCCFSIVFSSVLFASKKKIDYDLDVILKKHEDSNFPYKDLNQFTTLTLLIDYNVDSVVENIRDFEDKNIMQIFLSSSFYDLGVDSIKAFEKCAKNISQKKCNNYLCELEVEEFLEKIKNKEVKEGYKKILVENGFLIKKKKEKAISKKPSNTINFFEIDVK